MSFSGTCTPALVISVWGTPVAMSVVASISAASVYMNAVPLSLSIGGVVKDGNGKSTAPGTPGSTLSGISTSVGMISATPPVALGASGKQSSTTYSAIAPGTIDIASGDAASRTVAATIGRDTAGANAGADAAIRREQARGNRPRLCGCNAIVEPIRDVFERARSQGRTMERWFGKSAQWGQVDCRSDSGHAGRKEEA